MAVILYTQPSGLSATGNTGRVKRITDKAATGAFSLFRVNQSLNTVPLSFDRHRTIITRVGLSTSGNYQFLHTLGNDVFIYVFGDRMGQIRIHGISFSYDCSYRDDLGIFDPGLQGSPKTGFELLYNWYNDNRIARKKELLQVTIGTSQGFQGFVTSLVADVQDSVYRTVQYELTMSLLPPAN